MTGNNVLLWTGSAAKLILDTLKNFYTLILNYNNPNEMCMLYLEYFHSCTFLLNVAVSRSTKLLLQKHRFLDDSLPLLLV